MRILFVTNAARHNYVEPLGMMYLSSILQRAGHETRFTSDDVDKASVLLRDWQPGIVGYGITAGDQKRVIEFNKTLKRRGEFLAIAGGPHPTFVPEIIEEDGIDAICQGEGEEAFPELVEAIEAGRPHTNIANLWVKDADGTIHKNPVRPLIDDLDSVPFPDRAGFYHLYNRPAEHGIAHFLASRGCPFNCTFCFNRNYYEIYAGKGRRYRQRSPENVVAEAEEVLRDYPYQMAMFTDDLFPWDDEWLEEFAGLYSSRVAKPFICNTRVESVTDDRAALLKEAGCRAVLLGLESGDEYIRREILNRRVSDDEIVRACRNLRAAGIRISTSNMVGFPEETIHTAIKTVKLNRKCKVDVAHATFCQPYPGTELNRMAREMGLIAEPDNAYAEQFYTSGKSLRIPDKKRLERIRALMTPAVGMPFLIPFLPLLASLPLTRLYTVVEKFWVGYCSKFRVYQLKMTPAQFVRVSLRYFFTRQ